MMEEVQHHARTGRSERLNLKQTDGCNIQLSTTRPQILVGSAVTLLPQFLGLASKVITVPRTARSTHGLE